MPVRKTGSRRAAKAVASWWSRTSALMKFSFSARWIAALAVGLAAWPNVAFADGTAWLSEPGTGYLSLSYVGQTADEYFRSESKRATPRGENLTQNTVWLTANYALGESWALDARVGWARSDFVVGPMIPTTMANFSGLVDSTLGVTWRLNDELTSDYPSVAVRGGVVLAGNYETGHINSLGDGADGFELSVIVGEFVSTQFGLSAEFGYRARGGNVPDETFTNLSGLWLISDRLSLGLDYQLVDAQSGLDIGGPGFDPTKFPEVQEDTQIVAGRLYYAVSERIGLSVFHAGVVKGRNAPASTVYGVTASYSFDRY